MQARKQMIVAVVVGLSTWTQSARTAEQTPSTSLEEIIVTAQKRSESAQSVPLSMTTFGTVALDEKAIRNFFDYGTKVPNLSFAMTGDGIGTSRTIAIRGISGDNTTGFYIDEIPLPDSIDPRVLDIDHIEVLRGPQGTLYGARSMGGTVRIITQTPDFSSFHADVHGGLSDTWNTDRANYTGDGSVNIPIVADRVALRLSGFYDQEAGYFKRSYCTDSATTAANLNAAPTCTPLTTNPALVTTVKNVGMIHNYGGAAALSIKVNDSLMITPRIMMQRADYNGFPMADVLSNSANGYGYPVPSGPYVLPALQVNNFLQARIFNIAEGGHDAWSLFSLGAKWTTPYGDLVSSTGYFDRDVNEAEDYSDFIYAALLGGYQALPALLPEQKKYQRFVQEIRFVSQLSGPLQFVAGAFYSDLHGKLPFAAYYPASGAPGYGADLLFLGTCPPNAPLGTYLCPNPKHPDEIFGEDYHTSISEPAVFGEISYQFTSQLKGTVGLRWSQVKTTAGGYIEGSVTQSVQDYYAGLGQLIDAATTTKETSTTPKFQLDYHFDPEVMAYTMVAKGFRPGGLVPSVPAALCSKQLPAGISLDQTRKYSSDSLWNYEIGIKSSWLDNRLTLNGSMFYIDWKDIQQLILLGCGFQYRANAGAATSKGAELDLNARPIPPLQLSLGLGYQKAKITNAGNDSPQQAGDPVYEVPDWTANASVAWTQPVLTSDRIVSGLDYSYVGRSFSANNISAVNNFATRERPSYRLLNGRIAFSHNEWEAALVGKNLANEHANLADSRSIAAEVPGRPRLVTNQPRTIGIEIRTHF
jgi:outer membrane receptor protein involved in Fe transport